MKHDLQRRVTELDKAVQVIQERVMIEKQLPQSTFGKEVIFSADQKLIDPNAVSIVVSDGEGNGQLVEDLDISVGDDLGDLGVDSSQFHKD